MHVIINKHAHEQHFLKTRSEAPGRAAAGQRGLSWRPESRPSLDTSPPGTAPAPAARVQRDPVPATPRSYGRHSARERDMKLKAVL